ncbi:MAG: hypothetical protein V3V49_15445 [Candidatus Krumholzibacteria bacterium]
MRRRSLRNLGVVLCLLYTGQATALPVLHIVSHSAAEAAETACEDRDAARRRGPAFESACAGACSAPEHHHHSHRQHHDPTTCPVCASNQAPGICKTAHLSAVPSDGPPLAAGAWEIAPQATHSDATSPRAPPNLL